MSEKSKAALLEDYREAIRLHLWFGESKFGFHQAQKNKDSASRWLKVAHKTLTEYAELCKKESNPQ